MPFIEMTSNTFDETEFVRTFYNYTKDIIGDFDGDFIRLERLYKYFIEELLENNTVEQNKMIAESSFPIEEDYTEYDEKTKTYILSNKLYKIVVVNIYINLWDLVLEEFSICEISDADTDEDE